MLEVDRVADRFALGRRRPVDRGEHEVAGVEEPRRGFGDAADLLVDPLLAVEDAHAGPLQTTLLGGDFFSPFGEPRLQRFHAGAELIDAADERGRPGAQPSDALAEPAGSGGELFGAVGEFVGAAFDFVETFGERASAVADLFPVDDRGPDVVRDPVGEVGVFSQSRLQAFQFRRETSVFRGVGQRR